MSDELYFEQKKHNKNWKMNRAHFHNEHELYYLKSGYTKYFIGDELYLLNPGEMIFVPKGVFHKTTSAESAFSERILLSFSDDFISDEFSELIDELKENKHIIIPSSKLYKIDDIFQAIGKENGSDEKSSKLMQKLYFNQLLILISRYRIFKTKNRFDETNRIIQNAAKYISENYNADLSLDLLSKKHAMSPSHFSKQFKAVTGVNLSEYINITRIIAAEKLLINTSMPITKIATECGFNDSNYFASVFKKIKGITPKRYSLLNKP